MAGGLGRRVAACGKRCHRRQPTRIYAFLRRGRKVRSFHGDQATDVLRKIGLPKGFLQPVPALARARLGDDIAVSGDQQHRGMGHRLRTAVASSTPLKPGIA